MTERYKMEYHENLLEIFLITDTVEDHELTAEEIVDLLNENEKLKKENNDLIKLINDLGSEEMDRQMEEILND